MWYSFHGVVPPDVLAIHSLIPSNAVIESPVSMCNLISLQPERKIHNTTVLCLTTEPVQSAALSLQSVDNVERRDRLALGVLGVGDGVADDGLEERLEDTASLLVKHCRANASVIAR